jgi:hypothetical protein
MKTQPGRIDGDCIGAVLMKTDPITLVVIRHGLSSAANQVDANITRTAFSP